MAFGSGSITVAVTSMASSFDMPSLYVLDAGRERDGPARAGHRILAVRRHVRHDLLRREPSEAEDDRSVRHRRDRVLEMSGNAAVEGRDRPAVAPAPHARGAEVEHRLDGERHPLPDRLAAPLRP